MSEGRASARSRGRAKAKMPTPSQASAQAAAASAPPPTQPPVQHQAPPSQMHGRATVRAPVPSAPRGGAGDGQIVSQMQKLSVKEDQPPMGRGAMRGRREIQPALRTRPPAIETKTGSFGEVVRLQSNYFKLVTQTDWCLYQYRVDFSPDEERTGIRKKLLGVHREKLGGYIFDGSVMWATCLLRPDPMELFSQRESDQAEVKITIKKTVDLSVGDPSYIQLFNVITRKCLEFLELQLVGRDYFNPRNKVVIKDYNMELWPGYSTTIRQHEDSILMNVEITHKVMRLSTVYDIWQESYQRDSRNYQSVFTNAVVGSTVMTDYNQKTYRIDDIDFNGNPLSTFDMKGNPVTYMDYYKTRYGITIRDREQPLLISRTKARDRRAGMPEIIILIPELCRATGLTDEMRANVSLMRALADKTRIAPNERIRKLREFHSKLQGSDKVCNEFAMWNMKLDRDLIEFNGRTLPPETIFHGDDQSSKGSFKANWTGNLRDKRMTISHNLRTWAVIAPPRLVRDANSFVQTLGRATSSFSFQIPPPKIEEIPNERTGTYAEAIDRIVSRMNPELILCVVPNANADRYSAIKKKACVDRAIPTQVVLARNISPQAKGIISIATKIGIQINCKLGGAPWGVEIPLKGVMVVGFDTTHDTASKNRSFGATVCSLDKHLTKYYSTVSPHSGGEELSNQISIHIANGCIHFQKLNKSLPSKIIIYRDGVGEGQLHQVFTHEVTAIKEKLTGIYGGVEPKMAVVVVSKRINTRLFFKGENPMPGTIADNTITSPDKYDFFLVSQSVHQGTVSPTSYNIIYDTAGLPPDRMQRLTYKLTHLYFNWSGTVRVPAPCQYAHKLAMLVGQAIHTSPNPELSDKLYFL